MANAKYLDVKESVSDLKGCLKNSTGRIRLRLQMLIAIKQSKKALTKYELAELIGVNHNSITSWRRMYASGGLPMIVQHKQGGKRREVIDQPTHKAIEKRLTSPKEGFRSYKQLQQWVSANYIADIKYITILKYVQQHFGARLKMARKSHINKDDKAVEAFKKTPHSTSETY